MPRKPTDAVIRDAPIPWQQKAVLLLLSAYLPNVFPSQGTLARQMDCSRSTVNRRLAALEAAGFITRKKRSGTSTLYRLNVAAIRKGGHDAVSSSSAPVDEPSQSLPF